MIYIVVRLESESPGVWIEENIVSSLLSSGITVFLEAGVAGANLTVGVSRLTPRDEELRRSTYVFCNTDAR